MNFRHLLNLQEEMVSTQLDGEVEFKERCRLEIEIVGSPTKKLDDISKSVNLNKEQLPGQLRIF